MRNIPGLMVLLSLLLLPWQAKAVDHEGLKIVGDNGMVLRLDASTVIASHIKKLEEQSKPEPVYRVHFRLTKNAGAYLGKLTRANLSKPVHYILDNRVISSPVVRTSITGGVGLIATNSMSDAKKLLAAMGGTDP